MVLKSKLSYKGRTVHDPVQQARMGPIVENGQAAVRYVDDEGEPTEAYPLNPNGRGGSLTLPLTLPYLILPHLT